MFRRVILQIHFPRVEFKRIASKLGDILSIRYRIKDYFFYIGEVQDAYRQSPKKITMRIEVRKDETPGWYVKSIVRGALEEEILVMGDSEIISKGGRISNVEGLEKCSDDDIIEPLEVWIMAKT